MKWDSVFESYPKAEEIFVCDGMPFLTQTDADNHSKRTDNKAVEKVTRNGGTARGFDLPKTGKNAGKK